MLVLIVYCFAEGCMENVECTTLESILTQASEDFQEILPGSVRACDCTEFFPAKLLSPPTLRSALLKQYWDSVCNFSVNNSLSHRACRCIPRVQDFKNSWMKLANGAPRCSDGCVGNALTHHSTIEECDHTHAAYVDAYFARHSQVASQETGAVNVRNADMAMSSTSTYRHTHGHILGTIPKI
jgi:hypothetical protein